VKTPLRYPGGKTRAVTHILPLISEKCKAVAATALCSPFLGGGSIELAVAERGFRVYGYDVFDPIVWFWQALLSEPKKLAILSDSFRVNHPDYVLNEKNVRGLLKEDFARFRDQLKTETSYSLMNAARVYAINRSSFSGATFSGGFSKRASYARFTDSSIERVMSFKQPNLTVEQADFKVSIPRHPDAFLYCDPPYFLEEDRNKLYGIQGSTHAGFDHEGLHDILSQRSGWVLSYNNCPEIRKLYGDYEIIESEWAMGMKNVLPKTIVDAKRELVGLREYLDKKQMFVSSIPLIETLLEELKKPQGSSSEILIIG
jgi:DNA adenine methylase